MITLNEVLIIHQLTILKFGGSDSVRDLPLLESAVQRPYATFDQQELYPSPIDKAAAIVERIVKNHPFADGNKRTGYVLMRLILLQNNLDLQATENDKYDFIIQIAEGKIAIDGINNWIKTRIVAL